MDSTRPEGRRRCVVVVNPTKVRDDFRDVLHERLAAAGWAEPVFLETSVDDPGRAMTQQALASKPDLVIGAGGDGTIRVVADQMADSGVPMGIVAAGTANLLARNLELPLFQNEAVDVALGLHTHDVDLILLTADDKTPEHFAVMAGVGVDAVIMDEVDDDLKAKIGSVAYFLAAGKALGRLPMRMDVIVDGGRRHLAGAPGGGAAGQGRLLPAGRRRRRGVPAADRRGPARRPAGVHLLTPPGQNLGGQGADRRPGPAAAGTPRWDGRTRRGPVHRPRRTPCP